MNYFYVIEMELHFIDLIDFEHYEISIEEPHIIRDKNTHKIVEEWYNGYGDAAVLLKSQSKPDELFIVTDLVSKQFNFLTQL